VAIENVVELDRCRPRGRPRDGLLAELRAHPVVGVALAVATDEPRALEPAHEVKRLARERPFEDVPAEDDCLDAFALHVREHRLERVDHPMDVVQGCDPHPG
jgi:hypothetical protein